MKRLLKSLLVAAALVVFGPTVGKVFASNLHPPRFIHGHNICAVNVNRLRAALGLRQTHSASASSFLALQRVSTPKIGDVRFNWRRRGGHVAVYAGHGMCWNPSSRHQRWDLKPCASIWRGVHFQWRR
jgi:hypothetical protein